MTKAGERIVPPDDLVISVGLPSLVDDRWEPNFRHFAAVADKSPHAARLDGI